MRMSTWKDSNRTLTVLFFLTTLLVIGCDVAGGPSREFPPFTLFNGAITVIISEPDVNGHNQDYTYDVYPHEGTIRFRGSKLGKSDGELPLGKESTGHISCSRSPKLESPDRHFTVRCEGPAGLEGNVHDQIIVEDESGNKVMQQGSAQLMRVVGMAWSPDSKEIAVLYVSRSTSAQPIDWLAALTGHPVPLNTYYLSLQDVSSQQLANLGTLRTDSRYGFGVISRWTLEASGK